MYFRYFFFRISYSIVRINTIPKQTKVTTKITNMSEIKFILMLRKMNPTRNEIPLRTNAIFFFLYIDKEKYHDIDKINVRKAWISIIIAIDTFHNIDIKHIITEFSNNIDINILRWLLKNSISNLNTINIIIQGTTIRIAMKTPIILEINTKSSKIAKQTPKNKNVAPMMRSHVLPFALKPIVRNVNR